MIDVIRPGDRVLLVGPGTDAARIVERTQRTAASVQESRRDVETVRAALGPAGRNAGVLDSVVGNPLTGRPEAGPFDVVVSTRAVAGISPHWLTQLAPGGAIVAPLALGGLHPWAVVSRAAADGLTYGRLLTVERPEEAPLPAGGALYFGVRPSPAAEGRLLPMPSLDPAWAGVVPPRLTPQQYDDLWVYLAIRSPGVTAARVDETGTVAQAAGFSWGTGCAVVTATGAVHVRPEGLWTHGADPVTRALAHLIADYVQEWALRRRPRLTEWTCRITRPPDAHPNALAVAGAWDNTRPIILPR